MDESFFGVEENEKKNKDGFLFYLFYIVLIFFKNFIFFLIRR